MPLDETWSDGETFNGAFFTSLTHQVNQNTTDIATKQDNGKVGPVAVSGTPSTGQVPTATSGTTATWQTPSGGGGGGYVDPLTTAGDLVVRGASATIRKPVGSNLQLLQVQTANVDKWGYVTPDKTLVGLNLVDNTADANKPVSTAQAAANATVLTSARAFSFALSLLFGQG